MKGAEGEQRVAQLWEEMGRKAALSFLIRFLKAWRSEAAAEALVRSAGLGGPRRRPKQACQKGRQLKGDPTQKG